MVNWYGERVLSLVLPWLHHLETAQYHIRTPTGDGVADQSPT